MPPVDAAPARPISARMDRTFEPASAAARFRALHETFFVMPNPWDIATASLLAGLGFRAIATSSSAYAWTLGRRDGALSRSEAIAHAKAIGAATGLPVNGDFENGYGDTPRAVGETVAMAIEAGVAGCSVEDLARGAPEPLRPVDEACRRIEAAREAVERAGSPFVLTARCEAALVRDPNALAILAQRLPHYKAAGADVLYAPAVVTREALDVVLAAADGLPVNVLAGLGGMSDDLDALRALGVRRISLGSGLARAALGAFREAASALAQGTVRFGPRAGFAQIEDALPAAKPVAS